MYINTVNNENLNKRVFERNVGQFDIPYINPDQIDLDELEETEFISFNYCMSEKDPENKGVHFYVDDYQFQRVWNKIDRYIPLLERFRFVLSPDFSTYTDWPVAMNIYNHYRKHWCAAYMQEVGIQVIPTISWAKTEDGSSLVQLDGEPRNAVISVSSVGCCSNMKTIQAFRKGFDDVYKKLSPKAVLFFGNRIIEPEMYGCDFVFKETMQTMRFKSMK